MFVDKYEVRLLHENKYFCRGATDVFAFEDVPLLGKLSKLELEPVKSTKGKLSRSRSRRGSSKSGGDAEGSSLVTSRGKDPWYVDSVTVTHLDSGEVFTFANKGKPITDLVTLKCKGMEEGVASLQRETLSYEVLVATGDEKGAGSDSAVFITLIGEHGDSGERPLKKSKTHRDKFERGNTDAFDQEAVDLGELKKVKVRMESRGLGGAWLLDHVEVKCASTKKSWYFPFSDWVSKKAGLEHVIEAGIPESKA